MIEDPAACDKDDGVFRWMVRNVDLDASANLVTDRTLATLAPSAILDLQATLRPATSCYPSVRSLFAPTDVFVEPAALLAKLSGLAFPATYRVVERDPFWPYVGNCGCETSIIHRLRRYAGMGFSIRFPNLSES